MKMIKICEGINVSAKIFTGTYQKLEKFFGVPLTRFGEVMEKKLTSIDNEIEFVYIIISQDNDISKEDLIEKIDHDEDENITIMSIIVKIVNLFTNNLKSGNPDGEDKKQGNQKK